MIKHDKLGEGAYGSVYKVEYNGKSYAFKRNMVEDSVNFAVSLRELDIMICQGKHPNIIKLEMVTEGNPLRRGPMTPVKEKRRDDTFHFALELGNITLYDLLYTDKGKDLKVDYIQLIADSLLATEYMHGKGYIHRDIKPCNLVVGDFDDNLLSDLLEIKHESKHVLKLCDHGMAKPYCRQGPQTPRLATCLYRSPELIVEHPRYGFGVDIWSIGCIIYEIAFKRSFIKCDISDNPEHIMEDLLVKVGTGVDSKVYDKLISEGDIKIKTFPGVTPKPFVEYFNKETKEAFDRNISNIDDFVDLLSGLLHFDESKRFTATQALDHKFFNPCRKYIDLIRRKYPVKVDPDIPIRIRKCIERKWMFDNAFNIYRNRLTINWYSHRVLFQAIDLFDRYLHVAYPLASLKIETVYSGILHNKYETEYRFFACLYISLKYFSTLYIPPSFNEFISSIYVNPGYARHDYVRLTEEFEKQLVMKMLSYKVYRVTPYEIADSYGIILEDLHIELLLNVYRDFTSITPVTSRAVFDQFLLITKQK